LLADYRIQTEDPAERKKRRKAKSRAKAQQRIAELRAQGAQGGTRG
jgi:hypothetical protein